MTKAGKPCGLNPPKGALVCGVHGGNVATTKRQTKIRASEIKAREKLAKLAITPVADPITEHEQIMSEAIWFKNICRDQLAKIQENAWRYEHDHGEQLRAEVALYERAIDRCDKILTNYIRLGIADRKVRIDEAQAVILVGVIKDILSRLDLTRDQKALAGTVVPEALRAIEGPKDK
jgi:hypothetical protein